MIHASAALAASADRDRLVRSAVAAAGKAAAAAGVRIREIEEPPELEELSRLLSIVWNGEPASRQMTPDLLRALALIGNYVAGCHLDGQLIGAAVAFFSSPPASTLHSHITGVAGTLQARNVGFALKMHQRAWALQRGVATITWTFDPLVRRNAFFNIAKLGVRAVEYLPNFYGEMRDRINVGDQTDRMLVEWALVAPDVVELCDLAGGRAAHDADPPVPSALELADDGRPLRKPWTGATALLCVPPDIERLRVEQPAAAREWRLALREELGGVLSGGGRVLGFRREYGYVVETAGPT